MAKNASLWDKHYIEEPFNINITLPRLYISSCIFHSQYLQRVQPLQVYVINIRIPHLFI